MKRTLHPARKVGGEIEVPGDKSIAHRSALLSILASSPISITNFPDNEDCASSLTVAKQFGVTATRENGGNLILTPPKSVNLSAGTILDCGNSGTTARLIAGILAGSKTSATIIGDDSLSRRPMKRIVTPLTAMGAELKDTDGHLPLTVAGGSLLPFEYRLPVASAQVKSAVLLAGLSAGCSVTVWEDTITRDHTELMISAIGEGITIDTPKAVLTEDPIDPRKKRMVATADFKKKIKLASRAKVNGGEISIPGDFSSAAFFIALSVLADKEITIRNVGLNPTRTSFLDQLKLMGAKIDISDRLNKNGELRGAVTASGGLLKGRKVSGEMTVGLIDEIPILAVVAALSEGTTVIRDAAELRVKESDRLAAIAENLAAMGVKVGLLEDGLAIDGVAELHGADLKSFGDHRIAMAFSIAAMLAVGPSTIDDTSCVRISCPIFYDLLGKVAR